MTTNQPANPGCAEFRRLAGSSRRAVLQAGAAGMLALSLNDLLAAVSWFTYYGLSYGHAPIDGVTERKTPTWYALRGVNEQLRAIGYGI